MKKVLILEDKKEIRSLLANAVREVEEDVDVYEASDEKDASDIALKKTIDLFLVDLILHPENKSDTSGANFAENLRSIDKYRFTPIIVITSMYDPKLYMYSKVHCFRYIEKPFDIDKVKAVIKEAIPYNTPKDSDKNVIFRVDGILEMVPVNDIIYIESCNHKLIIHTVSKQIEVPYLTCTQMLKQLDSEDFAQCRRGTIVNIRRIQSVDTVNRYIRLNGVEDILEIGPIMKKEFVAKVTGMQEYYFNSAKK